MPSGTTAAMAIATHKGSDALTQKGSGSAAGKGDYRWMEFLDESIALEKTWIESAGIRVGQRFRQRYAEGTQKIMGDLNVELSASIPNTILLSRALGGYSFTDGTPDVHTITAGNLDSKFTNVWTARPQAGTTTYQNFEYRGMQVTNFEITADVNEYVKLMLSMCGHSLYHAAGLPESSAALGLNPTATPSGGNRDSAVDYPADQPFSYAECVVLAAWDDGTINDTMYIEGFSLSGDNAMSTDRFFIESEFGESGKMRPALENDFRNYTGTLRFGEYVPANYNRYLAAKPTFKLRFTAQNSATANANQRKIEITLRGRMDKPDGPNVTGPELVGLEVPFTLFGVKPIEIKVSNTSSDLNL